MTNAIQIIRGDDFSFVLNVEDPTADNGNYILKDDDALYLGVTLPHQPFEHAILKKKYTKADQNLDGNIIATIKASDTLDLLPGVYYYSVKLRQGIDTEHETVTTVIYKTKFIIND